MTYQASKKLIDILINNGFKDITNEIYPDHFKRLKENGYDPQKVKRVLAMDKRNYVKFDYINILPCYHKSCSGPEMKTELTSDEVKSIITFFKLPYQTRSALKRNNLIIPELYKEYYHIKENIERYKDKRSNLIIDTFENVVLN